jgi:hypothetical protein
MLCESLFHVLVEQGVISRENAIEAINGVVDLAHEMGEGGSGHCGHRAGLILIETIRDSFLLKDHPRHSDTPFGRQP